MSLRVRILIFLAVLMTDAALVRDNVLAMGIGVVAYLVVIFPALKRDDVSREIPPRNRREDE